MHSPPTFIVASIALLGIACAKPAEPSLDEVLEEFGRHETMNSQYSCECFELIGGGANYTSEQECLDAGVSIEAEHIVCMKDVLATLTQNEAEAIALMECYSAASQESAECKQANVGVCSADAFGDCVINRGRAINECDAGYSEDDLETLWWCRF